MRRGGVIAATRTLAAMAALAAALAGCGFHLQGVGKMPPALAKPYVDTPDRYSDFYQSLTEALHVSGSRLVGVSAEASAVVEILKDETGQRVLSVSSRNTPREYEVFYTVEYRVRAGDKELLPKQRIALTRDYSFVETELLAKQQEQELIRAALARELAGQVMRRLAALPPPPGQESSPAPATTPTPATAPAATPATAPVAAPAPKP